MFAPQPLHKQCERPGGGICVTHRQLLQQKHAKAYVCRSLESDGSEHEPEQESCCGSVAENMPVCCSDTVDCSLPDSLQDTKGTLQVAEEEQCRLLDVPASHHDAIRAGCAPAPFDIHGYMLAGVAVMASVLGRVSAEEIRYDASRLFRKQESSRMLNAELRRKRQEWKEQEEARLATEQKRRVEEVTVKARIEAEKQKKIQEKYEKEAREEAERRRKELEASRREYEETQRKLDLEYQERVRKEQVALEEARRLEQEKREREERERQIEMERKEQERIRQEELALKAKQEAAEARTKARKEAEKEMSKFAIRMEGSILACVPPAGTLLPGPLQEEARVRLCVQASSLLGGPGKKIEKDYGSIEELRSDAARVLSEATQDACEKVVSALQLQKMSGQGPLMLMEKPEVDHWMHTAVVRTCLDGLNRIPTDLNARKHTPGMVILEETFECRTESGVLPPENPFSFQQLYGKFLDLIIDDPQKIETMELFEESLAESNALMYSGVKVPSWLCDAPRNFGLCLALAHFVDRSLYTRPARESDAPAWFETCVAFSRRVLNKSFAQAPQDSLRTHSMLMCQVLTPEHPIAVEIADIADKNTSEQKKMEVKQKENARKAILAAKLLEEEWPDEEELRKARAKEREAKTPVTERIWALKNVASSLSIGGPGEVSRARQLLEQAVLLKQDMCELKDHPAVFPEALALLRIIKTRKEWENDAAGVASLFLAIVTNISRGYMDIGDELSACAVMELGLHEAEDVAGLRSTATIRGVKYLEACSKKISQDQAALLTKSRENRDGIEKILIHSFTDQLGAYRKDGTNLSKKDLWNLEGAKMLKSLIEN
jgi:hypothetical protein